MLRKPHKHHEACPERSRRGTKNTKLLSASQWLQSSAIVKW